VVTLISPLSKGGEEEVEEGLDKTELYVLETLNTIHKVLEEGFEYKDIVILTQKKSGHVLLFDRTEYSIVVFRDVDDPKRNRGEADYSSLKYLRKQC
jgi:hypothetical protein